MTNRWSVVTFSKFVVSLDRSQSDLICTSLQFHISQTADEARACCLVSHMMYISSLDTVWFHEMKEAVFYYGTVAYLPIYAHTVWAPYVIELGLLYFCGTFVKRFLALLMHTM